MSFGWSLWEREGVEGVVDGDHEVLAAVEHIGHRGSEERAAHVEVPESFSGGGIEGEEIVGCVGGEEQMAGGGEDTGDAFAFADFVIPDNFSGFVIECADRGIGPQVSITPAPAFGFGFVDSVVVDAENSAGVDIKKICLGIEAGSHPVGGAVGAGFDESAIGGGRCARLCDRTAFCVDAGGPGLFNERSSGEMLAVRAVKQEIKSVAAGLREEFARLALEFGVEKNGRLHGVPIVNVMRRRLEMPDEFAGVGIERDDGAGVKIVAGAAFTGEDGIGISSAPVEKIQIGIVGAGHPRHAAAVSYGVGIFRPSFGARFAGFWRGEPLPLFRASFWIDGDEEAGNVGDVAGDAGDDVIFYDERRHGGEVAELIVGEDDVPTDGAVFRVQANQMCVGRFDVDPVFVHGDATMADVIAFGFTLIVPDLATEFRVDGPNMVGRSEIHDAVDDERRGFENVSWSAINPGESERTDVAGVDLIERAVTAAGVVAVVGGPSVGGRVQ